MKQPGPVAALVSAAVMIGCYFDQQDGTLNICGRTCRWREVSTKVLKQLLQTAWVKHVVTTRVHRKHFELQSFDWVDNRKAMEGLTYHQKALVAVYQTGRHITNDMLSKFLHGVDEKCPLCGQSDSRKHRMFQCTKLADVRPKKDIMQRIQKT